MPTLQRATQADQKAERYHAILDAAERLWLAHPERMASVAEVAQHAGVGKGTVYLYFPSKEELLLALHSRHVENYFQAMMAMMAQTKILTVEQILDVVKSHMIVPPAFLPLASRCFALMEKCIPAESSAAFHHGIAQWLQRAGGELSRHFTQLNPEQAALLLMQSYGLIVGLWQLLNPALESAKYMTTAEKRILRPDYTQALSSALLDLWAGRLASLEAATQPKPRTHPNLKSGAKAK
jgi:AcrR family transcriptional regulator